MILHRTMRPFALRGATLIPVISSTLRRGLRTRPRFDGQQQPASQPDNGPNPSEQPAPRSASMSDVLAQVKDRDNTLLAPVHMPEDPNAVLRSDHPARNILEESGIVVQRQIEMMNLFIGFEQANRYVILDPHGNHIGYMAEHDGGIAKTMGRQWFTTHRAFTTHVFDRHSKEVLRFHRPFSWINSTIRVYDAVEPASHVQLATSTSMTPSNNNNNNNSDPANLQQLSGLPLEAMRLVGETQSEWAPLRRKYNLFLAHDPSATFPGASPITTKPAEGISKRQEQQLIQQDPNHSQPTMSQFAYVNEPFLSWDFTLRDAENKLIGSVNRGFRGFAREIFTDTGSYALRMDSIGLEEEAAKRHIISNTNQGERAYAEAVGGRDDKSGMTLDQRAVMLATAVTVDFDYFSRHSHSGGMGFMPLWMGGGGGEAAGGTVAGGAAGAGEAAGGAVVGGAGRAVGGVAGGAAGAGEGAIAGAGTMAGYEAMQRGMGRDQPQDNATPQAQQPPPQDPTSGQPYDPQSPQSGFTDDQGGDVWGGEQDPFDAANSGGGGGGEGGGGFLSSLWDSFFGD